MKEKKFKLESFEKAVELVKFMNTKKLTKDDIISITQNNDLLFLIYID